jgi:hypothetical protein
MNLRFAGSLTLKMMWGDGPCSTVFLLLGIPTMMACLTNWEVKNNLDKNNPEDRNAIGADGYTMLEKYLNSIK